MPLERIEGGKHFTPEDHPDRIASALLSLLRDVQRADAGPGPHSHDGGAPA